MDTYYARTATLANGFDYVNGAEVREGRYLPPHRWAGTYCTVTMAENTAARNELDARAAQAARRLQEAITNGYHEGRGLLRFGPRLYLERKRTMGISGKAYPWYMPGYGPISAGFAIGLILAELTDQQGGRA